MILSATETDPSESPYPSSDPGRLVLRRGNLPVPPNPLHWSAIADRRLRRRAAIDKESGRWVGRIGLNLLEDWPDEHKWEIGFELHPDFWGRGLATEGGREAVRAGFENVGLDRIISVASAANAASRRVMQKCGLTYRGTVAFRGVDVVWYAIDR